MHKLMLSGIAGMIAGCFLPLSVALACSGLLLLVWLLARPLICLLLCVCQQSGRFSALRVRNPRSEPRRYQPLYYSLFFVLTLLFSSFWVGVQLEHRLPVSLDRQSIDIQVAIRSIEARERGFRLTVDVLPDQPLADSLPALRSLQLNWYPRQQQALPPQAGQTAHIRAVLRAPRNFANGLAFDYEAYLLSEGIDATGYIRTLELTSPADGPVLSSSESLRQRFISWGYQRLPQYAAGEQEQAHEQAKSWAGGLIFGDQQAFTTEQWDLAAYTGTLHLLVVSGLHVGLIALLGWLLGGVLMRFVALFSGVVTFGAAGTVRAGWSVRSVRTISLIAGMIVAPQWLRLLPVVVLSAAYVWLAGAGIALQRAALMIALAALLACVRRRPDWLEIALLVMLLVLLINPLIWLRPGFGFSFCAVLALLAAFRGRKSRWAEQWWLPQWLVFMAILPLMLFWGQAVGFQHLLANFIAVPFFTLILMPLTFAAVITGWDVIADGLIIAGDLFWQWLSLVEGLAMPQFAPVNTALMLLWYGLLVLFWLGVQRIFVILAQALMLAGLLLIRPADVNTVSMADVGQGLSVFAGASDATLIYDLGARFSDRFDAGSAIVFPLLQSLGVRSLDLLVISHNDNDHAGGEVGFKRLAQSRGMDIGRQIYGQPAAGGSSCHALSSQWQEMHPNLRIRFFPLATDEIRPVDNNASCVLQLDWFGTRFLLTGDLEADGETLLADVYGAELRSEVLVVGHHGSLTSTSGRLLQVVQPMEGWISAGFNNRFGHPHPDVLARLHEAGVRTFNTAECGRIFREPDGVTRCQRKLWQPRWRQPL